MFAASRAGWVPVFMATATSAWASAGASFVPSPVMATILPPVWYSRISFSLLSGVASARKSSTPASAAIVAAVRLLSPVIMTVLIPIFRSWANRSFIPPFTISFKWMTPSAFPFFATTSGVPPAREIVSTASFRFSDTVSPLVSMYLYIASAAPFRTRISPYSTPLIRVWLVNGMNSISGPDSVSPTVLPLRLYFSFASTTILRPSGVSSASEASWAFSARSVTSIPSTGMNSVGLPVPERDSPGLIQEEDIDIPRSLDGSS